VAAPKYQPLKPVPGSEYQPPEPGPVEKRIQQLEDLVIRLLKKIGSDTPPAEAAANIRASATPFNEKKEHPGGCPTAHPDETHEEWENTP